MSENNQHTFTPDDVQKIETFLDFFQFDKPDAYKKAVQDYRTNPDSEAFKKTLVLETAKLLSSINGSNELIDLGFKDVFPSCTKMRYELEFDKDLEDIVGVDPSSDQA